MLNLSVVATAEHQQSAPAEEDETLPHGTAVLKQLGAPWAGSKLILCAYSYFASVATAEHVQSMGLRFIGVVNTATRGYPMGTLSAIPLQARGQHVSFTHTNADGVADLIAVVRVDRERRYVISTASTALPGAPSLQEKSACISRVLWPRNHGCDIILP